MNGLLAKKTPNVFQLLKTAIKNVEQEPRAGLSVLDLREINLLLTWLNVLKKITA
jgi:hypothetical protein